MMNSYSAMTTSITRIKHVSLQHAVSFRLCSESMLGVPRSIILDGVISYGGSTGYGFELVQKAFGEYYERNHFFTAVPITSQKSLEQIVPGIHQNKLSSLCRKNQDDFFTEHDFSFTTVYNLFTRTPVDYFFNAISLRGVKQDVEKLNVTDSCGCATHTTQEAALHNALIEFLERQALLGSWLSNRYRYAINPEVLRDLSPYTSLVENILDNGELHIFEIGHDLPGYNIVMFYFSHSATDAVQYSVGSKTSGSLADAITSAFAELYQCYTFLYSAVFKPTNLSGKAGSGYHLAFTKYNTQATKLIIPYLQKNIEFEIKTLDEVRAFPTFEHVELLKGLQLISSEVYFYHYYEAALKLHFIKVLSPDFFPHMSLDKLFDLNMLYAQKLGITMDNAYLELLPFP